MSKEIIAAALVFGTASGAWADLSAPAVWSDWQSYYTDLGGSLTADQETYADGTLTLTDISVTFDIAGQTSEATYGSVDLVEQSDGTLRLVFPERIEGSTTTTLEGETVTQDFVVTQTNLDVIVQENDAGGRTYDMDAAQIVYEVTGLSSGRDTPPATITATMDGLSSRTDARPEDGLTVFSQEGNVDTVVVAVVVEDQVDMTYTLSDMVATGGASIEEGGAAFMTPGSRSNVTSELTHQGATLALTGISPQGQFDIAGSSETGSISIDMNADQVAYDLGASQSQMTITLPNFPTPVNAALASSETSLVFPISEGEEPKPYSLKMAYRELTLDDAIWSLFDPTGQLSRDPATLVVDIDGTAGLQADLFDPEAFADLQGPPILPQTLVLNTLNLALAGAELAGTGDLAFVGGGRTPQPVGRMELSLDGGFALLDGLVAMGVLPQQQAGFIRGMSGAVAQQVGDDRLETVLEFTPEGGIVANGMPLR